jgi:hypothetical protein
MKRTVLILSMIFILSAITIPGLTQKISGRIQFEQGQVLMISTELKSTVSQEAMGNAIDFSVNGEATHAYKVTNATGDNSTLHHDVRKLVFSFDGMGQKRNFDSENKKDMDGMFGPSAKDMLSKTFDMIIDSAGKTLLAKPEKVELTKADDRLTIVFNMLRDITSVIYPPTKGQASFFKILPDKEISVNEGWVETMEDVNGKFNTVYTLSGITDSTIVVDFKGNSVTNAKAEMRGMQTSTTMNNNYTGKIIIDKITGILREKTTVTESTGTTEVMGGTLPVTSKTTVTVRVNPAAEDVKKKTKG